MPGDEFLVLHALRLRGLASAASIEESWGACGAEAHLERLAADGLCQFRDTPRAAGYMLLPAGRERHTEEIAALRAEAGAEAVAALEAVYQRFIPVNEDFKALCSRWQIRGAVLNDHTDPEYDAECIASLEDLHGRFLPVVTRAGRAVAHFRSYPDRFRTALRRLAEDGDLDYFTRPLVDSYHTVWFEFHEDLIVTLGRERQAHEA